MMKTHVTCPERLSLQFLFFRGGEVRNADYLNIMYLSIHSFGLIKSSLIINHSLFNR